MHSRVGYSPTLVDAFDPREAARIAELEGELIQLKQRSAGDPRAGQVKR
jgi:hypothetical protein